MKTLTTLTFIALFLVACDKQDDEATVVDLNTIDSEQVADISASLDTDEQEMEADFHESFEMLGLTTAGKKGRSRTYNDTTGEWTVLIENNITRTDSIRFPNRTVVKDWSLQYNNELVVRFTDGNGQSVKLPGLKRDSIQSVSLTRNRDVTAEATVTIYRGNDTNVYREKNRDAFSDHTAEFSRQGENADLWDLTLSGSKNIDIEIQRNDTIYRLNRTMSISTNDLVVRHTRGLVRRNTRIVSGETIRTINFTGGHSVRIETEYFERGDTQDDIRYTRNFYKDNDQSPFRTVTVYY